MARIFDVVEYPSEMPNEIVHHFPETGIADIVFQQHLFGSVIAPTEAPAEDEAAAAEGEAAGGSEG